MNGRIRIYSILIFYIRKYMFIQFGYMHIRIDLMWYINKGKNEYERDREKNHRIEIYTKYIIYLCFFFFFSSTITTITIIIAIIIIIIVNIISITLYTISYKLQFFFFLFHLLDSFVLQSALVHILHFLSIRFRYTGVIQSLHQQQRTEIELKVY